MNGAAISPALPRTRAFRDAFGLARLGRPELLQALAAGAALAAMLAFVTPWLAPLGALPPAFVAWFFRDPHRRPPPGDELALAPADGVLDDVRAEHTCPFFDGPALRLGVYLSLFDVHVNRAPVGGVVVEVQARAGARVATWRRGCTDGNEQVITWFRARGSGRTVVVRQLAGPITRRLCHVIAPGEQVAAGERFGLIKFGSRTELWLPADAILLARPGQRVRAGESVLAALPPST